ncbi:hypothetical protein B4Q13_24125, partial [Lacticaseibacillus rhamnosus]
MRSWRLRRRRARGVSRHRVDGGAAGADRIRRKRHRRHVAEDATVVGSRTYAFDRGVTHFDLANNYGPPYGSAEENFGLILKKDFRDLRDELVISSKAGYDMWPGPYGIGGSRKYLLAS